MRVIQARNVNDAYSQGMQLLHEEGRERESRNGKVLEAPWPVATVYGRPLERVLFDRRRRANPWLHLLEAIWMLQGRRDVAPLALYAGNMRNYSDDGTTLHGAYGHRWRHHWDLDQLDLVAELLEKHPDTRRAVMQMWDPERDCRPNEDGRDMPCNTACYFRRDAAGALHLTVTCRSNDIIWGAYGSNQVTFSVLLEYMAARVGCAVGTYAQFSNSFHAYREVFEKCWPAQRGPELEPYETVLATPLFDLGTAWVHDASLTDEERRHEPRTRGLHADVWPSRWLLPPLVDAWAAHKRGDDEAARDHLRELPPRCDWRLAAEQWLEGVR